jgi:HEAT repeat protein
MRSLLALLIIGLAITPSLAQDKVGGKTLKQWSTSLKHSEARVRYQAVAALYEEGADAAPLVKELIPLLKDPQPAIRRGVAQVLANCKADAALAVPALVLALRDSDYYVRGFASQALNEVGEAAADPLVKLLEDKDATTRLHSVMVINGLNLQGKDIAKALAKATKDANVPVRQAALFALSKLETDDPEVFNILGSALADKEKQVRLSAASILMGKGKDGSGVLAKAADDPQAAARILALQSLAKLGEDIDEKGVTALRKALGDSDVKVRQTAALALAGVGKTARELGGKDLFEDVAKLLQDKDIILRRTAIYALNQFGSNDIDEMKLVAGALKDADAMVRSFTIQTLAKYAKDTEAVDLRVVLHGHLIDALQDKDRRVQFLAAQALTQEGTNAVEALVKVVDEGKGAQRLWAATILGEIGPGTFDAIPALEKMAKDNNPEVRRIAMAALQKIMGDGK